MASITGGLTAQDQDQLRNPYAPMGTAFTFLPLDHYPYAERQIIRLTNGLLRCGCFVVIGSGVHGAECPSVVCD